MAQRWWLIASKDQTEKADNLHSGMVNEEAFQSNLAGGRLMLNEHVSQTNRGSDLPAGGSRAFSENIGSLKDPIRAENDFFFGLERFEDVQSALEAVCEGDTDRAGR